VLCDPSRSAYRACGIGQRPVERILYDAPAESWSHPAVFGAALQDGWRRQGAPLVEDPWRATAEFVVRSLRTLASRTGMRALTVRALLHAEALGDEGAAEVAGVMAEGIENPVLSALVSADACRS
jgi:hypothetical protein